MEYTIKTDLHTHTMVSDHAYSTLEENICHAGKIGLEAIAMTNHTMSLGDAPHSWHFGMSVIPKYVDGVRVLRGCEANILDKSGRLDIDDYDFKSKLDIVIASIHSPCYEAFNEGGDHTSTYMGALENPAVDILGHSGYANCPYDFEAVAKRAKELSKLIEINSHTFNARTQSVENCRKIALACKKTGTGICVSSDAHFSRSVGDFKKALDMLSEIDFPEELIINRDYETLKKYFAIRKEI